MPKTDDGDPIAGIGVAAAAFAAADRTDREAINHVAAGGAPLEKDFDDGVS